jgi:hypothetical protein
MSFTSLNLNADQNWAINQIPSCRHICPCQVLCSVQRGTTRRLMRLPGINNNKIGLVQGIYRPCLILAISSVLFLGNFSQIISTNMDPMECRITLFKSVFYLPSIFESPWMQCDCHCDCVCVCVCVGNLDEQGEPWNNRVWVTLATQVNTSLELKQIDGMSFPSANC